MVFSGNGISYTELKSMDLAEFAEAVEAKCFFDEEVRRMKEGGNLG